ncbi:MAG: ribosome small subunit-dependent GTPase A [Candidatus Dormibacteria bacterium]
MHSLEALGWRHAFQSQLSPDEIETCVPARVVSTPGMNLLTVVGANGQLTASVPGRLRHRAQDLSHLPVVGDWVLLGGSDPSGAAQVVRSLDRQSCLVRKVAGTGALPQPMAANVDLVLVVTVANESGRMRKLERYLTFAWDSGATPVVVVTKADSGPIADLPSVNGVEVVVTSSVTGVGIDRVAAMLAAGATAVLAGPSGTGKSTLVNRLLGEDRLATAEVRDDGRGRHTTTRRELFLLPEGGAIIDTPGLRELGLWVAADGLDTVFDDIGRLALECRFPDCAHSVEPGCAVLAAESSGGLDPGRLDSWRRLQREQAAVEARGDARLQAEQRRAHRERARSIRRAAEDRPGWP